MDIDPLADSVPPRHAIESDEEEDEYNPLRPNPSQSTTKPVVVQLVGDAVSAPAPGLLVATGAVGAYWARGANLGEQVAAVMVDNFQVGMLFRPSWTKAVVLVSEAKVRLPLAALHPYAAAVLDALQPATVGLLDTYAVPTYIAETRIPFTDAPLRFLATPAPPESITAAAQPFEPPNLLQGASAAFVALRAQHIAPAALLLVPAPHIAPPAPRALATSSTADVDPTDVPFSPGLVGTAHAALGAILPESNASAWTPPAPGKTLSNSQPGARKRPAETEWGMYI
ncbi:hypothetical protein B0H11DRAFT_1867928 [Mycena galericulata]|nr:hypothetical protein B0H11DRAFT_1867928 [Mycena galericulata]